MEKISALLAICVGIHRSPVNSPHKGQWHWALMFSLICAWINGWAYNREAGDLRRHHARYNVTVMNDRNQMFVFHIKPYDWNDANALPDQHPLYGLFSSIHEMLWHSRAHLWMKVVYSTTYPQVNTSITVSRMVWCRVVYNTDPNGMMGVSSLISTCRKMLNWWRNAIVL